MEVTVLGSCTVVEFPEQIDAFFDGDLLVDIRNGCRMEMDVLPLFFFADFTGDDALKARLKRGVLANLQASGGELWQCGVWGHNEVHLRFTSVALRYMLLTRETFEPELLSSLLTRHFAHGERAFGGYWFYHDSIETHKQAYYKPWDGKEVGEASDNNMLIINTHLDSLITLLMAKKCEVVFPERDNLISDALKAIEQYFSQTRTVGGALSLIDSLCRSGMLWNLGKRNLISRITVQVVERLYYRRIRYWFKHKVPIRRFSSGFLERDIRLTGPSLEYHVVNLWDMARLLLWFRYCDISHESVERLLTDSVLNALKYCHSSRPYRSYMRRLSKRKGVSNEVLEAILIMMQLGHTEDWMAELYLDWRTFAAPSAGVMGLDKTLTGFAPSLTARPASLDEASDWVAFSTGRVVVANRSAKPVSIQQAGLEKIWQSQNISTNSGQVEGHSLAVFKVNRK